MKFKNEYINPHVFWSSTIVLAIIVCFTAIWPDLADRMFSSLQGELIATAGWFYIIAVAIILISVLYFAMSRHGNVKLGPDHAQPDYSMPSWFAMLFSAGIGIGLLFFGVAEPVMHYLAPPNMPPETIEAAREAMNITFFHWGLHAWSIYAIVGLALAYYSYRHKRPLALRSALYPIFGHKVEGPLGHAVDTFAIIGTTLGVATSLGFGVTQINAGLSYIFPGFPKSELVQVGIIVVVTAFATLSVMSGLDRGVRRLSELNMILAVILLLFILFSGPTLHLIQMIVQNTGTYLSTFVEKTFNLYAYRPTDWIGGWTLFYWGWWISWSPFVGMFIARISRGRTIRQFILGVTFVPTGFTFAWMTIFGNSAIDLIRNGEPQLGAQVQADNAIALFKFLEHYPMPELVSGLALIMIVVFFVTSADSGALVVNMLASNGRDKTPVWQRVYWASTIGILGSILLLAGGLSALQTATIISALPFAVIILMMLWGLFKSLSIEDIKRQSMMHTMNTATTTSNGDLDWEDRLDNIANLPKAKKVEDFITSTVREAFDEVSMALIERDLVTEVSSKPKIQELIIRHGEELDFVYRVKLRKMEHPNFLLEAENEARERDYYFRADVYLREGGQDYDVMGYSKEQIINDILDQYEKHRQFLDIIR